MVRINWTNAPDESEGFSLIPVGTYNATVFSAEEQISKSSGNPMITLVVRLTDAPFNGRRLTSYFPISDKSLWKLRALLTSCGFLPEALEGEDEFDPDVLIDEEVLVEVVHEDYNGETRAKAKSIRGTRAAKQAAAQQLAELAAAQTRLRTTPTNAQTTTAASRAAHPGRTGATPTVRPFAGPARQPVSVGAKRAADFLDEDDPADIPF